MKRLLTALTITLATVAFAKGDDAQKQKEQNAATAAQKEAEVKAEAERTGKTEAQVKAETEGKQSDEEGIEATDVGGQLKKNSEEWAKQAGLKKDDPKEQAMFKASKQAFNVTGIVKGKPGDEIELTRTGGLPDVKLDIRKQTVVMLDGKKIEAKYLPEGAQVKASFQLDGDDPVALKLTATSKGGKGVGGSGLEEQENKGLIGAEEVGPKAKEAADKTGEAVENAAEGAKDAVDGK